MVTQIGLRGWANRRVCIERYSRATVPLTVSVQPIAAGLDGVERGLQLADPVEESLFEMDAATIASKGIRELPGTLGEALEELEKDSVIRDALGDHVFSHYVEAKRAEWDEYRTQVSGWEVDRYLDQF